MTGRVQVLLAEQLSEWEWRALVRPGRKVLTGEVLNSGTARCGLRSSRMGNLGSERCGSSRCRIFSELWSGWGTCRCRRIFIARIGRAIASGTRRCMRGSAGRGGADGGVALHAGDSGRIRARGVEIASVTLHVGLGTFQPVRVERVEEVRLHAERYTISAETAAGLNAARREGRRIVAAGTTTVRTLEHCALAGGEFTAHSGVDEHFHRAGIRISHRGGAADEFSFATVVVTDAGERICGAGTGAGAHIGTLLRRGIVSFLMGTACLLSSITRGSTELKIPGSTCDSVTRLCRPSR